MGYERRHRGNHPEDERLFSALAIPTIRLALSDYCWLLSRGYAEPSSLKLVGDKFRLEQRQRLLLMRSACTDTQRTNRLKTSCPPSAVAGRNLSIDGFNLLITVENALSGGLLFVGIDGCYRDMASVHGTYKRVCETQDAIRLVGEALQQLQVGKTLWLLDKPVSNSGKLRDQLIEQAAQNHWDWNVELCQSPDEELKQQKTDVVVSTDSVILDHAECWFHLNQFLVDNHIPNRTPIDLRAQEIPL